MSESDPKDLRYAENLRREGKFQEALEVVNNIEKKGGLIPADQLSLFILKGKILTLFQRHVETIRVGKLAYRLSQTLGETYETITSLLFRANCLFIGQYEKSLKYLSEAQNLLNSLPDVSPSYISRQNKNILFRKAWAHYFKGNYDKVLEEATECLDLQNKLGSKTDIAYTLQLLGAAYISKDEFDLAVDYVSRSLTIFEELGDQLGMGASLISMGTVMYYQGELNKSIEYCKKSLSMKIVSARTKLDSINILSLIYGARGELDKALKYLNQGIVLAEKENFYNYFVMFQANIGNIYILKGQYDRAIEYLKPSLSLAEKIRDFAALAYSLIYLGNAYFEKGDLEEVQKYLDQIKKLEIQTKFAKITSGYLLLKGKSLLKKGGSRNRVEAETLLKQVSTDDTNQIFRSYALILLCEFYLEEANIFEDTEVLVEIYPLISQLFKISEEQHMHVNLANAKLLQAKVALIEMKFEDAQRLLTQAQRVAELHGLNRLAQKISSEHDNYLEKLNEWKELEEKDAPVSERLKLASVEDVLERLQGKLAIEPLEVVEEEPIVLLILEKSGISYFTHSFRENWDFDWLFSSFMSAFDTFSSEVFSESIDRIIIGENLILINPIESFLVCYVIKGQSYPGLQKLNRFSEAIKNNTEIWESLNKAVKTGEVLELNRPQALGNVVNEIFSH